MFPPFWSADCGTNILNYEAHSIHQVYLHAYCSTLQYNSLDTISKNNIDSSGFVPSLFSGQRVLVFHDRLLLKGLFWISRNRLDAQASDGVICGTPRIPSQTTAPRLFRRHSSRSLRTPKPSKKRQGLFSCCLPQARIDNPVQHRDQ